MFNWPIATVNWLIAVVGWFADNAVGLGIIGAACAFVWSIIQYMLDRRREARTREFDVFHRLIKELVSPENGEENPYIDRQAAIVFELRNFPRYYEFTYRTLYNLKEKWSSKSTSARIVEELDFTMNYIKARKPNIRLKPDSVPERH